MLEQLGIMLVEENSGEIGVQLFADVKSVDVAFENLQGKLTDNVRRATLFMVHYLEDGKTECVCKSKMFPLLESKTDIADGYVLGQGPVKFDENKGVK